MVESFFLIFVIFQNIVVRFLPNIFSYWDELLCIVFVGIYFINLKGKLPKTDSIYYMVVIMMTLVGLAGNIEFEYQSSLGAIFRDIVGCMKFPLVFLSVYRMKMIDKLTNRLSKMIPYIKIYTYLVLFFGVFSIFFNLGMSQKEVRGLIHPYMFLYTHPTYLTTGLACILCILNAAGAATLKEDIVILCSIALAMRTKGLAFIAVYVFLKYGACRVRKLRFLYWPVLIIIVYFVARSKLQMYASFSNSPRESLYIGALNLAKQCFPIGSGFASYASHVSGKYFSQVYHIIHIAGLYDINGQISASIGDAGIPYYLGQFGVVGTICFVILITMIIKMSTYKLRGASKMAVIYLWLLIVISLPSEAILVNNGFELAFVMVLVSSMARKKLVKKMQYCGGEDITNEKNSYYF